VLAQVGDSMRIVIKDATTFKSSIDAISNLVDEGVFDITDEGISLRAMDPSQISMISFSMPKSIFSSYEVSEDTKIGVDIEQLSAVLSRSKKTERLVISVEDGKLLLIFEGANSHRTFKIPLIDIQSGADREPSVVFESSVTLSADGFKDIIKDAKLVSSHIELSITKGLFKVRAHGDGSETSAEFDVGSPIIEKLETTKEVRATFPIQYLENMIKGCPSSEKATVFVDTDKPLKMKYSIGGATVTYYLAPRIEIE